MKRLLPLVAVALALSATPASADPQVVYNDCVSAATALGFRKRDVNSSCQQITDAFVTACASKGRSIINDPTGEATCSIQRAQQVISRYSPSITNADALSNDIDRLTLEVVQIGERAQQVEDLNNVETVVAGELNVVEADVIILQELYGGGGGGGGGGKPGGGPGGGGGGGGKGKN